jgi:hypothetical protein
MGNFWKFFFTINSTNFAIVWEKNSPIFNITKISGKKKKNNLTTMQKKGG